MFFKSDRPVKIVSILVNVLFVIEFIASFLLCIIYTIVNKDALYLLIFPVGAFASWVVWIWARLYISLCCDIKLIRNKLYNSSNQNLAKVFDENYILLKCKDNYSEYSTVSNETANRVEHLNRLLDAGAISKEEYNKEIKKLLDE